MTVITPLGVTTARATVVRANHIALAHIGAVAAYATVAQLPTVVGRVAPARIGIRTPIVTNIAMPPA